MSFNKINSIIKSINSKFLRQFLLDSNSAGYAGGKTKKWIKDPDGSTTIPYEKGFWKSHDNFFGGEPYGVRTIVFYKNKPVWLMVYYGWVVPEADTNQIYEVLRSVLKQMPKEYPFRGPRDYKTGKLQYENRWVGEVDRFSGEEKIIRGRKLLYKANYLGGLVDQRGGI